MDFSLLIKPASADCNLRCAYCFYLDRQEIFPAPRRMQPQTLDTLIAGYMPTQDRQASFIWQGGEPTLMGLPFFQEVTRLQQVHGRPGQHVVNALQTNATLIDDAMAAHFAHYRFLVGVSLDGPPVVHDRHRRTAGGRGCHRQVLRGLEILGRHQVAVNVLCVVTAQSAGLAAELVAYYRDLGLRHLQFIPCVAFDAGGTPLPFTVRAAQWGRFLCQLFDAWYPQREVLAIRLFDDLLALMGREHAQACHLERTCGNYLVVENDGTTYPCDFFVDPDKCLGDIHTETISRLAASAPLRQFGNLKAILNQRCRRCDYLPYCRGDCLKHRCRDRLTPKNTSWLCEGWRTFFAHALPRLKPLARPLSTEGGARRSPGRNAPCPCGSGKKFKRCCLSRAPTAA